MAFRKLKIEWTNIVESVKHDDGRPYDSYPYPRWEGVNEHGQRVRVHIKKFTMLDEEDRLHITEA